MKHEINTDVLIEAAESFRNELGEIAKHVKK